MQNYFTGEFTHTGRYIFQGTNGAETIIGSVENDALRGDGGNDILRAGAGDDVVYGGLGDDTITVDGTGNKTIDGGAGTDSLIISYTGIGSLNDFTISKSGDYTVFASNSGGNVSYKTH